MRGSLGGVALVACVLASTGCGEVKSTQMPDATPPGSDASLDAPTDAPTDTPPDAPPVPGRYDVGYTDVFSLASDRAGTGILGFMVVVNNGPGTLNLSKIIPLGVTDDSSAVSAILGVDPVETSSPLGPGEFAGELGTTPASLIIPDLVPETRREDILVEFGLRFSGVVAGMVGSSVRGTISLMIDDTPIDLPFTLEIISQGGPIFAHASRRTARVTPQ